MIYISNFRSLIASAVFVFTLALGSIAQVTTADISGTVEDSGGQVVSGATVTLSNPGTGFSRTFTTNSSGGYTFTDLPPGNYVLTVEAANFSKAVVKDVELNVGVKRSITVQLKPGVITETVEI